MSLFAPRSALTMIGILTAAVAFAANPAHLKAADRKFVDALAHGNQEEVDLGNLAKQRGQSDAVRNFGQRMIDDHAKLEQQLKEWASTNDVTLPEKLTKKEHHDTQKLEKLSGKKFDEAYIQAMVSDHKKDVHETQQMAQNADDPRVKELASKTLPVLEEHLKIAENVASELGVHSKSEKHK